MFHVQKLKCSIHVENVERVLQEFDSGTGSASYFEEDDEDDEDVMPKATDKGSFDKSDARTKVNSF